MAKNSIQSLATEFLQTKSHKTFKSLINRIKPGLSSYIYKNYIKDTDKCKDIISTTLANIWNKIDQYDSERGYFSTWAYKIAANVAIAEIKNQRKNLSHENLTENHSKLLRIYSPTYNIEMEVCAPVGEILIQTLYDASIDAIQNLKEPYKKVATERIINDKPLQDIAVDLNWHLSTVKTRFYKAQKLIKNILEVKYPELIESYHEN